MLKRKLNDKKGFTLAELLIVVAIIGILVAVSVPIFTSKLNDARVATDQANIRAAKAAAVTEVLSEEAGTTSETYFYDAASGMLKTENTGIKGYGKSGEEVEGATGAPEGNILQVAIDQEGNVTLEWVAAGSN